MRTFCFILGVALTGQLFAQDQGKPYGRFYGPLATGDWKAKPPALPTPLELEKLRRAFPSPPPEWSKTHCAVPLTEMVIPGDVHFTAEVLQPDMQRMAPMPEAKLFAPACDPKAER